MNPSTTISNRRYYRSTCPLDSSWSICSRGYLGSGWLTSTNRGLRSPPLIVGDSGLVVGSGSVTVVAVAGGDGAARSGSAVANAAGGDSGAAGAVAVVVVATATVSLCTSSSSPSSSPSSSSSSSSPSSLSSSPFSSFSSSSLSSSSSSSPSSSSPFSSLSSSSLSYSPSSPSCCSVGSRGRCFGCETSGMNGVMVRLRLPWESRSARTKYQWTGLRILRQNFSPKPSMSTSRSASYLSSVLLASFYALLKSVDMNHRISLLFLFSFITLSA